MSFPRYPAYKDSGVEWVGEVPAHWTVMPLKRDIEFVTSGARGWAENYADDGDLFLRIGNLTRDSIRLDLSDIQRVVVPEGAEVDRTQVQAGDILFSITAYLGSVAVVPEALGRAFVSQHVALVRLGKKHITAEWSAYVAISYVGKTHLETTGYGGTKVQLSLADVVSLPMVVPPIDEQVLLVRFLDHETAKIDALVSEQERLIELLKEKRQAVISHAVTKGLDPSVPMKDSGVEWLGDVPAHWQFGPIKYFLAPRKDAIKTGPFGSHLTAAEMEAGPIKVYNQRNVIDEDFQSGDNFITEEKFEELHSFEAFPGDLLITTRGTIGRAAILPANADRGILHPCLIRIQPDTLRLRIDFLRTLVRDSDLLRKQLAYQSNATTIEVIYSYTIAAVVIPVPPINEQDEIMKYLSITLGHLDGLMAEAQRSVQLLLERRTTLISSAVTGQIDVRGWVPAEAVA